MPSSALANLERLRRTHRKPAEEIFVWLDAWPWFSNPAGEVHVSPSDSVVRLDLRPMIGCPATLFVPDLTQRASVLVDRLRELCPDLTVIVVAWLDRGEVGFRIIDGGELQDLPKARTH